MHSQTAGIEAAQIHAGPIAAPNLHLPAVASREVHVSASEVVAALSYALDLTEGQPMGHAVQSCLIGMRIARAMQMPLAQQSDLYYALLLKDAGCSSNASKLYHLFQTDEICAKRNLKDKDWARKGWETVRYAIENVGAGQPFLKRVRRLYEVATSEGDSSRDLVAMRCERGAEIARRIGFSEDVAQAIASLDEHWNGEGYPHGRRGEEIPLLARIMNLAQTAAVFWCMRGQAGAEAMLRARAGQWFDPELVRLAVLLSADGSLWEDLDDATLNTVVAMEPQEQRFMLDERRMDNLCVAFAEVIDAKSPFTYRHSQGVAAAADCIAGQLGLDAEKRRDLRRAALLHDIGKLAVPNSILEKPGKLDPQEWEVVKLHPFHTLQVLKRIPGFAGLSEVAAAHHERLDGSGYFRRWAAPQMDTSARILAVADVFDALAAARPYRQALPLEKVFGIMESEAPHALDADCLAALETCSDELQAKLVNRPDEIGCVV